MSISIRTINIDDSEHFFSVRNEIILESNFLTLHPGEDDPDPDVARRRVRSMKKNGSEVFLAVDGELICGFLSAVRPTSEGRNHSVSISMGVKKCHWVSGSGSSLVSALHDWANTSNTFRIECYISKNNYRSLSIFMKRGYIIEGMLLDYVRSKEGVMYDKYVVAKTISKNGRF